MKILKKAHGIHAASCPIGGHRGADKCRHAANCNCEGGERVDVAYAHERIQSLILEIGHWNERLAVSA